MKKYISVLTMICVFAVAGISGAAAQEAKTANPASDFDYDLTEDGKGVIIKKYRGSERRVSVPDVINGVPVVALGKEAFSECGSLHRVVLPKNLQYIGDFAFSGSGLEFMTIPDSVIAIGVEAFAECTDLKLVNIGKNVISIGSCAFGGCESLQRVNFGFTGKIPSGPNATLFGKEVPKGYEEDVFYCCPSLDSSERKRIRDTGYNGVF